jgi:hypothetical protein
MKHIFYITLICVLGFSGLLAQNEPECGLSPQVSGKSFTLSPLDLTQKGGLYVTAQGEIKVLVVFVRFKDDVSSHPYWPVGQPPLEFSTYIDPNFQTGSTNYLNLTNYFKQMSFSVFKVTGTAVYVETPNNRSYYGSNYY